MKNTILFGNGFNRLAGQQSWDELIGKDSFESCNSIPNTIIYEAGLLKDKDLQFGKNLQYDKNSEYEKKALISETLKKYESNFCYEFLVDIEADYYLTTNYDRTLLKAFQLKHWQISEEDRSEDIYSIRRHYTVSNLKQKLCTIWPIHGDVEKPISIMLGLDQYCGSIGKMNDYLKGGYTYRDSKKIFSVKGISKRLRDREVNVSLSWIDAFFVTNVHIIAFGLQYEEVDLWWLLVWRKRAIEKYGETLINNTIYFYGEVDKDKQNILRTLGVEIVFPEKKESKDDDIHWNLIYKDLLEKMQKNIENCKSSTMLYR